jgi:glutamate-ammonia-ligase adenylyltransferase
MRELIAQEKGDDNPWDLKLARGGLTDLDFIAQALVLAYGSKHPDLIGLPTEDVFARARQAGLITNEDARTLIAAHQLFNTIFQWQRLMVEGSFDATAVPKAVLQRLAAVAGLPSPEATLSHLLLMRAEVRQCFEVMLSDI